MTFVFCVCVCVFTPQIEFYECCVWFQCITQWWYSSFSNVVFCWFGENGKRVNCWWMSFACCFFCVYHPDRVLWVLCLISMHHSMTLLLFLQCRSLLIWWEWEKSELLMDVIYVLFLSCPPQSVSSVSALFDFNASLNDCAPLSPMFVPINLRKQKSK